MIKPRANFLIEMVEATMKSRQVSYKEDKYAGIKGKDWLFISAKYLKNFPPDAKKVLEKIKEAKKGFANFSQEEMLIWKRESDKILDQKWYQKIKNLPQEHQFSFMSIKKLLDEKKISYEIEEANFSFFVPTQITGEDNLEPFIKAVKPWRVIRLNQQLAQLKRPKKQQSFGSYSRSDARYRAKTGKNLDAPVGEIIIIGRGLRINPKGMKTLSSEQMLKRYSELSAKPTLIDNPYSKLEAERSSED